MNLKFPKVTMFLTAMLIFRANLALAGEGAPSPQVVTLVTSQNGVNNHPSLETGAQLMDKFLARTTELGGKYTLTKTEDQEWIAYRKKAGEDLTDQIVNQLKGCTKIDQGCIDAVKFYNRTIPDPFASSYSGELTLPALSITLTARIDYGENFRVAQHGNQTTYYVKKDINDSLKILSGFATWLPIVGWIGIDDRQHFFKTVVED